MKDRIGYVLGSCQVKPTTLTNLGVNKYNVAQDSEQQLTRTTNHLPVNKGRRRRRFERDFEAAVLLYETDGEVPILFMNGPGIIRFCP